MQTQGLTKQPIEGTKQTQEDVAKLDKTMSEMRSKEVKSAVPSGENQWSMYTAGKA